MHDTKPSSDLSLQLIGVVKPRKPCRGVELSHGMVGEREGNHPQIAELVELSEA